jgi:hypothetical protein
MFGVKKANCLQQRFAIASLYRYPQTFPLGILGVMFGVNRSGGGEVGEVGEVR